MMNRHMRMITAVVAAGLVLATGACGQDKGSTAASSTVLQMWGRSDNQAFLPGLVDAFNASHKDVQVKLTLVPAAQVAQKFSAAASGGDGPDLVSLDVATVPQYATAGWLADVTTRSKSLSYLGELSPSHLELATLGDALYALPFTADVSVLYYNKALFKQAGLDPDQPPTTWAQIRDDATAVRALGPDYYGYYFSGACGGCMAFTLLPYVWADGGEVLKGSEPGVTATISPNAELANTLGFFKSLWDSGVVPAEAQTDSGADQFGPFFSGKTAMFVNGSYPIGTLKSEHPDIDFGVTLVPGETSGTGAYTGGDSIAITKKAAASDVAWEVVSWMTSTGQEKLAAAGVLPTRLDIAKNAYAASDPRLAVLADALSVGHTPNSTHVAELFFDNNGPWSTLMQSAIFSGGIDAAAQAAQESMSSTLAK